MTDLLDGSRAAFRALRLSLVETVFLAAAILFAVLVAAFYLTKITPRELEFRRLQNHIAEVRADLSQQDKREKLRATQRESAQKILDSLNDFEARLKRKTDGTPQVMDEFPQLAKANNVAGGGVTFRTIEPDATDNSVNPAPGVARNNKQVSVYPALGLDTTVEGDYHDLRRFISDLERGRQFIIINSITLQSVDPVSRRSLKGGMPAPGLTPAPPALGQIRAKSPANEPTAISVSLKIETDTYFQK
jgi:Tfp pilus assembly protein PilO